MKTNLQDNTFDRVNIFEYILEYRIYALLFVFKNFTTYDSDDRFGRTKSNET
jgi:hypothetical protein